MKKLFPVLIVILALFLMAASPLPQDQVPTEIPAVTLTATIGGVPIILVVMALTKYSEKFGAKGRVQLGIAILLGLVFGFGYMSAANGFPVDFAGYFTYIVFGLAMGIVPSGIHDELKSTGQG